MKNKKQNIKLGHKVRDIVSGIAGITTERCENLNGVVHIWITPDNSIIPEGAKVERGYYVHQDNVRFVNRGVLAK